MAKLTVFNANGKVNRTLIRKLDENPLSYKLPRQFICINDTNTIEQADQWLTTDRQMRMTFEGEYEDVGNNFIQTKWGNEQMASSGELPPLCYCQLPQTSGKQNKAPEDLLLNKRISCAKV